MEPPAAKPLHLFCPVDFSELSATALRYAGSMADVRNACISVLYAQWFPPPPYFTKSGVKMLEAQLRAAFEEAQTALQDFVQKTLPDGQRVSEVRAVEGPPAEMILKVAREVDADCIVMATHGQGGPNRLQLGSVTERVLLESEIPVLTMHGDLRVASGPLAIHNVVCAVNESNASREALSMAARVAIVLNATLHVLHVEDADPGAITDVAEWIPEGYRSRCQVLEHCRKGVAWEEILSAAEELQADLVVIGGQHRSYSETVVTGSTTMRVVSHANCPVLTVTAKA